LKKVLKIEKIAEIVKNSTFEFIFPLLDFLHDFLLTLPEKRWVPAQHNIKNNPTGPNIAFLIIALI